MPAGGYRCSAADDACPTSQLCRCGLCVDKESQAACALDVTADVGAAASVREHQPFSVTLTAHAKDGTLATDFAGDVDLSFALDGGRWGDVRPKTARLAQGTATLMVTLNRETIPPQTAHLAAQFAETIGESAPIAVVAQPFVKDTAAIAQAPFGWANAAILEPTVVADGAGGFRMYFQGTALGGQLSVGLATSTDGKKFTPALSPVFPDSTSTYKQPILTVAPFGPLDAPELVFSVNNANGGGDLFLASATGPATVFDLANAGAPVLERGDCPYCDYNLWFPSLIPQMSAASSTADGGAGDPLLMFFAASHCNGGGCSGLNNLSMSIGRAESSDGKTFIPAPAPVLSGEQGGEAYLAAPHVILDGSVYRMWYAFARSLPLGDPCSGALAIGYATSADGFFWVRSPSNPVLTVGGGWESGAFGLLPASVLPLDGNDPESGLALYYSVFRRFLLTCLPLDAGRAVAM